MHFPPFARPCMVLGLALISLGVQATELTVSAAASLTNAFKEIGQAFEASHPGDTVVFNFGASGALLQQIAKGAPVDVFASADQDTMDKAADEKLIQNQSRRDFARNTLVLVTPADSKLTLARLEDLLQTTVQQVAIGQPASVPVGHYTQMALEAAKLWPQVQAKAIYTQNVRQSLDYAVRGEVQAAFVYNTDAALMKDKVRVAMNVPLGQPVLYPIASVQGAAHASLAQQFVEYVLSAPAQAVLARYGFAKP